MRGLTFAVYGFCFLLFNWYVLRLHVVCDFMPPSYAETRIGSKGFASIAGILECMFEESDGRFKPKTWSELKQWNPRQYAIIQSWNQSITVQKLARVQLRLDIEKFKDQKCQSSRSAWNPPPAFGTIGLKPKPPSHPPPENLLIPQSSDPSVEEIASMDTVDEELPGDQLTNELRLLLDAQIDASNMLEFKCREDPYENIPDSWWWN